MIKPITYIVIAISLTLMSCSEKDTFSTSPVDLLTFSEDSVSLDTVFSTIPTATHTFWVYNHSDKGIRCTTVRLQRGNQTGFRVNVDGTYLGQSVGYQTQNVEVRGGDSIRVFVELTSPYNYEDNPKLIEDNLIFSLESGNEQKVNLNAHSWDAIILNNVHIDHDSTLNDMRPIIIYGGITVDKNATLTIPAGTTIYFHHDACLDVYGTLHTEGTADREVILRGDRIDRMFNYLPYDNVSGQWKGIRFHDSSFGNKLNYTDIHSTYDGIICDSSDISQPKVDLEACTVHNCQGYGIWAKQVQMSLRNCQITNTLNNCLHIEGGQTEINNCTIAQFYPFDSQREPAFYFSANDLFKSLNCQNTLITGYENQEMKKELKDSTANYQYLFADCIVRMPQITTKDSTHFIRIQYEDTADTTKAGHRQFMKIDTENLKYDFRLKGISTAIGKANPATAMPTDRNGLKRDDFPDIGAYETRKTD